MHKFLLILTVTVAVFTFSSCKKSSEEFQTASISDYAPYEVGKYITYALDSTVFVNFGATMAVRSYEVKYVVDAQITDNLNRPAYRIIRYIRKTPANPWLPDATFEAVNTSSSLEFKENNERYIKLRVPIYDGYSWKGNSFIDTYSANTEVRYLDDWDYVYDSVGVASTIGAFNLENTLKVNQRDEVIGNPSDPGAYSEINKGVEKYAKGIGMVYRLFFHSEYQPGGGYYQGYGVQYTMIDHN